MKQTSKYPLVLVRWTDSKVAGFEWEYLDGLDTLFPSVCQTIGFLLYDGPDFKTLAMTQSPTQILGRLSIPTVAVLSIHRLKKGKRL